MTGKQLQTAPQHLGELGKSKGPRIDLTFGWFGHQIRVNPGAGELELIDFMTKAAKVEVPDDDASLAESAPAMEVTLDFLRRQIHPDDWDLFWDVAKTNRQSTMDLMEIAMQIVEAVSGFPTTPPSDSRTGRRATKQKSKGGSSSPATPSLTSRALELLRGRPDLQDIVLQAQTEREHVG